MPLEITWYCASKLCSGGPLTSAAGGQQFPRDTPFHDSMANERLREGRPRTRVDPTTANGKRGQVSSPTRTGLYWAPCRSKHATRAEWRDSS
jgi:hypothetical protein